MNEKEANDYINKLLGMKGFGLRGLEADALLQYSKIIVRIEFAEKVLREARQMVADNVALIQRLKGQCEVYVALLILEENNRRNKRAKMDAQKIQKLIKDGKARLFTFLDKNDIESEDKGHGPKINRLKQPYARS